MKYPSERVLSRSLEGSFPVSFRPFLACFPNHPVYVWKLVARTTSLTLMLDSQSSATNSGPSSAGVRYHGTLSVSQSEAKGAYVRSHGRRQRKRTVRLCGKGADGHYIMLPTMSRCIMQLVNSRRDRTRFVVYSTNPRLELSRSDSFKDGQEGINLKQALEKVSFQETPAIAIRATSPLCPCSRESNNADF